MESLTTRNPASPRGPLADEELNAAYRTVFLQSTAGNLVLVDLCDYSGWNKVSDASDLRGLAEANGMRALFARIFNALNLTSAERDELAAAARREANSNMGI